MSRPEPYRMSESSRRRTAETVTRRGRLTAVPCPRAAAAPAPPPFVEGRRRKDARLELAVALDREERAEQRDAAHEVVGAVDRVDVPADRGLGRFGAELLADQPVVREGGVEPLADHLLDRLVGLGHEAAVGLGLDDEVAPEVGSGE